GGGDGRTGHDDAGGDDGVGGVAQAALLGVDELRGRLRDESLVQRPLVVVDVEHRLDRDEVHVRVVVRVDGSHVAPVVAVAIRGAGHVVAHEVVEPAGALVHEVRHDVAAHVVLGGGVLRVLGERVHERVGVRDVVAHGGQDLVGGVGQAVGV